VVVADTCSTGEHRRSESQWLKGQETLGKVRFTRRCQWWWRCGQLWQSYGRTKRTRGQKEGGCSRELLTLTKWSRGVKVEMVAAHAFYSGTAGWGMDGGGCHAAVESGGHPTTVRRRQQDSA
jgi:hypothetical protein